MSENNPHYWIGYLASALVGAYGETRNRRLHAVLTDLLASAIISDELTEELWRRLGEADSAGPAMLEGHLNAEHVEIEGEEDGWYMRILTTDDGSHNFRIHGVAWELAELVDRTLGEWRREGLAARGLPPLRLTEEDLDAYPLGSPKRIALQRMIDEQR